MPMTRSSVMMTSTGGDGGGMCLRGCTSSFSHHRNYSHQTICWTTFWWWHKRKMRKKKILSISSTVKEYWSLSLSSSPLLLIIKSPNWTLINIPPCDCPAHIVIIIIISSAAGELVSDEVLVNIFRQSYIHRHLMITIKIIIRLLLARYYLQCCSIIRYWFLPTQ